MGDTRSSASRRRRPTRTSSVTRLPAVRPVDIGVPSPALREAALLSKPGLGKPGLADAPGLPPAPPVREAERLGKLRAGSPLLEPKPAEDEEETVRASA